MTATPRARARRWSASGRPRAHAVVCEQPCPTPGARTARPGHEREPGQTASVATSRGPKVSRDRPGRRSPGRGYVLPDTARRCVRPAARKASVISAVVPGRRPAGEPREQAALALGQHLGAGRQGAAKAVGRGVDGPARAPRDDGVDDQAAGDVPVAEEPFVRPGRGTEPITVIRSPARRSSRAGAPRPARPATGRSSSRTSTVAPPPVGDRVTHERDLAPDGPRVEGPTQPGHAALAERCGQEQRRGTPAPAGPPPCRRRLPNRRRPPPGRGQGDPRRWPSTARAAANTTRASTTAHRCSLAYPSGRAMSARLGPCTALCSWAQLRSLTTRRPRSGRRHTVTPSPGRAAARAWPRRCPARRAGRPPT